MSYDVFQSSPAQAYPKLGLGVMRSPNTSAAQREHIRIVSRQFVSQFLSAQRGVQRSETVVGTRVIALRAFCSW